ncbi:hypothetical protein CSV69_02160 [Sporosarcina sp. P26b]|uniref:hypothetical protein n=1 Tax=Sporosarcina TaxID=1569 RepID=UPI000A17D5B4|nr:MULTISPECIES: hypothetical protein [Sporosarcina]ARK22575.1 hypothetical protein SporoP32a_14145 [Sporosarcina ureae]PIC75070.1 hypothetical protein CSV76_00220 [Sporosarcina sp. P17b]PIC97031.1 hypothetical protein CSV69_02160 [Sporosarcina sp. P26b]
MEDHLFFYLDSDAKRNRKAEPATKENHLEGIFLVNNKKIRTWKEMASHCVECMEPLHYSDEFDARYCKDCDEWREMICDPNCKTCQTRPVKPSDCTQDFE